MRIRFFFWVVLICTCVSVLTFSIFLQKNVPALSYLSLDHPSPKVRQMVTLSLRLTDTEGVPIDNASVITHMNMTTMDMQDKEHHLQSVGKGKYIAHLQFSMAGSWFILTSIHAKGIVPAQQKLFVTAT